MRIGSIVVKCKKFDKMLAFWQEALHYVPKAPPKGGWVILRDPEGKGPNVSLDKAHGKERLRSTRDRVCTSISTPTTKKARLRDCLESERLAIRRRIILKMTSEFWKIPTATSSA